MFQDFYTVGFLWYKEWKILKTKVLTSNETKISLMFKHIKNFLPKITQFSAYCLCMYINKCLHFLSMHLCFVITAAQWGCLRLQTAQVRVRLHYNPCGICCIQRQNGSTAVFPLSITLPPALRVRLSPATWTVTLNKRGLKVLILCFRAS